MATVELTMTSQVPISTQQAWAWAMSLEGVNAEMQPLVKMVFPKSVTGIGPHTTLGKSLGRCKFFLFGVFPIDMSKLTFTEMVPGHRFVEQSQLLSMRSWRHERVITPGPGGRGACITDHLAFTPRLATPVVRYFVKLLFEHRHKMMVRALAAPSAVAGRRAADRGEVGRAR